MIFTLDLNAIAFLNTKIEILYTSSYYEFQKLSVSTKKTSSDGKFSLKQVLKFPLTAQCELETYFRIVKISSINIQNNRKKINDFRLVNH